MKFVITLGLIGLGFSANAQTKRNIKQEEVNKKMVSVFYQKLFGDLDLSVIDQFIVPNYIQHSPDATDGREALKKVLAEWFKTRKNNKIVEHWDVAQIVPEKSINPHPMF